MSTIFSYLQWSTLYIQWGDDFRKGAQCRHITSISPRPANSSEGPPSPADINAPITKPAVHSPPTNLPSASTSSILLGSKFIYGSLAVLTIWFALKFKQALQEFDFADLLEGQLGAWLTKGPDFTKVLAIIDRANSRKLYKRLFKMT